MEPSVFFFLCDFLAGTSPSDVDFGMAERPVRLRRRNHGFCIKMQRPLFYLSKRDKFCAIGGKFTKALDKSANLVYYNSV